jgi:hypothetical protein
MKRLLTLIGDSQFQVDIVVDEVEWLGLLICEVIVTCERCGTSLSIQSNATLRDAYKTAWSTHQLMNSTHANTNCLEHRHHDPTKVRVSPH